MTLALTIILCCVGIPVVWAIGTVAFYMLFVAKNDGSGDAGLAFMLIALLPVMPFVWLYDAIMTKRDPVRGRVYRWPTKKQRADQLEHDQLLAERQNENRYSIEKELNGCGDK